MLKTTFENMKANEIAKMLLRSQLKINKKGYYRQQLDKEKRKKGEGILNAFTRAEVLIKKIHPGVGESESKRNLLLQCLASYTPEPMSSELDKEFAALKLKGEKIDVYEAVKSLAKKELVKEYTVNMDLPFKKKIKS